MLIDREPKPAVNDGSTVLDHRFVQLPVVRISLRLEPYPKPINPGRRLPVHCVQRLELTQSPETIGLEGSSSHRFPNGFVLASMSMAESDAYSSSDTEMLSGGVLSITPPVDGDVVRTHPESVRGVLSFRLIGQERDALWRYAEGIGPEQVFDADVVVSRIARKPVLNYPAFDPVLVVPENDYKFATVLETETHELAGRFYFVLLKIVVSHFIRGFTVMRRKARTVEHIPKLDDTSRLIVSDGLLHYFETDRIVEREVNVGDEDGHVIA